MQIKMMMMMMMTAVAPSKYNNRHKRVAGHIHRMVCKHMGLQVTDKYYEHVPERVINVNITTVMWDILVITVRKMLGNQPDIILPD
jgi:hemoglobin-like flavoprotein